MNLEHDEDECKQIAFDLDTKVCKQIMGNKYNHIYDVIQKFMKDEGFVHIQGSVYISEKPMSVTKVHTVIDDMLNKYPLLSKCVRDITHADIGDRYSLNHRFDYDGTAGKFKRFDIDEQKKNVKDR